MSVSGFPDYPGYPDYPAAPPVTLPEDEPGSWRRLNRRMLLVHPVQDVGRSIPALIAIVLGGHSPTSALIGLAGAVLVALVGVSRWFTTRFRVDGDAVRVEHGLLRRRIAVARLDRVRTVDLTAHLLHRALGLAKLVIGTGQNDKRRRDHGFVLDGLTVAEAHRLRDELLSRTGSERVRERPSDAWTEESSERSEGATRECVGSGSRAVSRETSDGHFRTRSDETLFILDPRWSRYAPFTLSGAITGLALLGLGWRVLTDAQVEPDRVGALRSVVRHLRDTPIALDVLEVLVVVLVVVSVLSVAGYVLAFSHFRLTRRDAGRPGATLHVERGLLTTRATTIEESRLRGVEIGRPLLLRRVGGARLLAVATGLRRTRGAERSGAHLVPPAPLTVIETVASRVLGDDEPVHAALVAHPAAALQRRVVRAAVPASVVAAGLAIPALLGAIAAGWAAALVLVPLAVLLGRDRYRALGHTVTARHLVTRSGSLAQRRVALETDGVIGWTVHRSLFQRRAGVVTLVATTAAGKQRYRLTDVSPEQAAAVVAAVTPELVAPTSA